MNLKRICDSSTLKVADSVGLYEKLAPNTLDKLIIDVEGDFSWEKLFNVKSPSYYVEYNFSVNPDLVPQSRLKSFMRKYMEDLYEAEKPKTLEECVEVLEDSEYEFHKIDEPGLYFIFWDDGYEVVKISCAFDLLSIPQVEAAYFYVSSKETYEKWMKEAESKGDAEVVSKLKRMVKRWLNNK